MTEILTRTEAAEYLKVSTKTLDLCGIPRIEIGRAVRYARDDISAWIKAKAQGSASSKLAIGSGMQHARLALVRAVPKLHKRGATDDFLDSKLAEIKRHVPP